MEDNVYCWNESCSMIGVAIPYAASQAMQNKCPACKNEFHFNQPESPSSKAEWPGNLSADTLPTWLAYPWAAYCEETHPRVKLHWLCDTAELVVRWTVALALAEVVHTNDGTLKENVARVIADHIERPTLGRWLAILRELCNVAPLNPVLTYGLFDWAKQHIEPHFQADGENKSGTLESSLLVLRNQVAHGGGMARDRAAVLVTHHEPTLINLLKGVRDAMGNSCVIANGMTLRGLAPTPCENSASIPIDSNGTWLVGENEALPLEPLAHYGPVLHVDGEGQVRPLVDSAVAQMYTRGSLNRLSYTTLGRDQAHSDRIDVDGFRALFQLDSLHSARKVTTGGFSWDDFLRESRLLAENLIGRSAEIQAIKAWLKSVDAHDDHATRLGWISAGPGVGKSMVMARLASDYGNSDRRGLYVHRFRAGDARNNRRAFLRLLQAALWAWTPLADTTEAPVEDAVEGQALEDDVKARLSALASLEPPNERSPRPAFWVFIDGLDEAIGNDPSLPDLLRSLAVPGTVWLIAGRPEKGLDTAFAGEGCTALFKNGLPPMHADDIRAMLLEGLDVGRYALLARDEDTDSGEVRNAFVEGVVSRAKGLPIYIHLLLEDLRAGHLNVNDEERLPNGLTAYYDELVDRLGVSDAKADLTAIVAILSQSMEPLDEAGLALLLAGGLRKLDRFKPRVSAAIRIGNALLKRAASPDTEYGWTLYHQSFREYISNSPSLAGSVEDARERLAEAPRHWAVITERSLEPIRKHLFRWGTEYALWWIADDGIKNTYERLTNFEYLQARTASLPGIECTDLVREYQDLLEALPVGVKRASFKIWAEFFREKAHLLREGNQLWGSHKILLQLAMEHADNSPVALRAEMWLEEGRCDWSWLRDITRAEQVQISPCQCVLSGHRGSIEACQLLNDGRILSCSADRTMRIWDTATGESLLKLKGHRGKVTGAKQLPDGRIVSWSAGDGTLRIWDGERGKELVTLKGHTSSVFGAVFLSNNLILSWSRDQSLKIWNADTGKSVLTLLGHGGSIKGIQQLPNDRLLSWSEDGTLRVWSLQTGKSLLTLRGHRQAVVGALLLSDGRVLSWSWDGTLRIWSAETGRPLITLAGHTGAVVGAQLLPDDRILSWSWDGTLRIWDPHSGALLWTMEGHADGVVGTLQLPCDRILSWSWDKTLRIWDAATGKSRLTLTGHADGVIGACLLSDSVILSWSWDGTLREWDTEVGVSRCSLEGHFGEIGGTQILPDGRILSWSWDGALRIWEVGTGTSSGIEEGHTNEITGTRLLPDGRVLSWSEDRTLRIWDAATGQSQLTLAGHIGGINGALSLPDSRILSWSRDGTLRIWNSGTGDAVLTLKGHTADVEGAELLTGNRLLSWSTDSALRVWNTETGECQQILEGHTDIVFGAQILPNDHVLTWSRDKTLRMWDAGTSKSYLTMEGHSDSVFGALQLPDGRILSWSRDGTLRVWDAKTGESLLVLTAHSRAVLGAQVLPKRRILSWSKDGTLRTWDVETGRCLAMVADNPYDRAKLLKANYVIDRGRVGLVVRKRKEIVMWTSDGVWQGDLYHDIGKMVVFSSRYLRFLGLYHGASLVT